MSKLVIFDVDGTILDSISLFEKVMRDYSLSQGLPHPNIEEIKRGYGHPHKHDFGWGVSKEEQKRHLDGGFELMDHHERMGTPEYTPQLFDGVKQGLVYLKNQGHTLAIITSKPEGALLKTMERQGIKEFFSACRTGDDVERRGEKEKPEPDMLLSVLRELSFTAPHAVMVGDTTMDMRMGRAAETHTVGVTWGAHPKAHLVDAGAHHIVETEFNDVMPVIGKIFE